MRKTEESCNYAESVTFCWVCQGWPASCRITTGPLSELPAEETHRDMPLWACQIFSCSSFIFGLFISSFKLSLLQRWLNSMLPEPTTPNCGSNTTDGSTSCTSRMDMFVTHSLASTLGHDVSNSCLRVFWDGPQVRQLGVPS